MESTKTNPLTETQANEHAGFARREKLILEGYERAVALRSRYASQLPKNWHSGPPWPYKWDYNLLHDLVDRMTQRAFDLQDEYHVWHWNNFGFNAYL